MQPHTHTSADTEVFEAQQFWVNRVNGLYTLSVGILGGMSLAHLLFLLPVTDYRKFLTSYCPFAKNVNLLFLIFVNIALVTSYAITLIYQ